MYIYNSHYFLVARHGCFFPSGLDGRVAEYDMQNNFGIQAYDIQQIRKLRNTNFADTFFLAIYKCIYYHTQQNLHEFCTGDSHSSMFILKNYTLTNSS